ncbi:MAG TPA: MmcQ/YjbR family DNA-binding protein [Vicinamibacterales bacterium]
MTGDDFREIALTLDGVIEKAHMNHPDFRVNGRIFASLLSDERRAGLRLSPEEQRELVRQHPTAFQPASGAWGRQGWTIVDLAKAPAAVVRSALILAYAGISATARTRRSTRSRVASGRGRTRRG